MPKASSGKTILGRNQEGDSASSQGEAGAEELHVQRHKDGSLWARGPKQNGVATGYWEWFRKDGTKLRSGYFEEGEQVGDWTTYDRLGQAYKVTNHDRKDKE